jgi:hypothetical protein
MLYGTVDRFEFLNDNKPDHLCHGVSPNTMQCVLNIQYWLSWHVSRKEKLDNISRGREKASFAMQEIVLT